MKRVNVFFFILVLSILGSLAFADDCDTTKSAEQVEEQLEIKTDVPKWLEGATITVKLANGQESTVKAEQFKVVPRKQQFIVTKTKQHEKTVCSSDAKNRISILGGVGPSNSLDVTKTPTKATVSTESGAVGGLMYQRKLGKTLSVGGQVQTNESVLGVIGIDF